MDISFTTENDFYSVGYNHFVFWSVDNLKPTFMETKHDIITCADKYENMLIIALNNGYVEAYNQSSKKFFMNNHTTSIDSMII